jgi:hypothetical protein
MEEKPKVEDYALRVNMIAKRLEKDATLRHDILLGRRAGTELKKVFDVVSGFTDSKKDMSSNSICIPLHRRSP